jgi:Peptidase family M48
VPHAVTGAAGLRRVEFAVAALGVTAFLLALVFVLDAVRFHGDVLVSGSAHGLLLSALALADVVLLIRGGVSLWRGARVYRRQVPVLRVVRVAGRDVHVVAGSVPLAFCAGLVRPRVYLSEACFAVLGERELAAVVAHEGHHADRRDPLRVLVARAIGDAYALRSLAGREQAVAELSADAAAVERGGVAPLASALLAFESAGIAPERVDRLAGAGPANEVPRALTFLAATVLVALLVALVAALALPGEPRVCLPLASAPGILACAVIVRVVALGPAWLGWRRAGLFLRA